MQDQNVNTQPHASHQPDAIGFAVCLEARGFVAEAAELRRLATVEAAFEQLKATLPLTAKRWDYLEARANQMSTAKYESLCYVLHLDADTEDFDIGKATDGAIEKSTT